MKRKNDVENFLRESGKTLKEILFITKDKGVEFDIIIDTPTIIKILNETEYTEEEEGEFEEYEDAESIDKLYRYTIRTGIMKYVFDTFEILFSNDPSLLGEYYGDDKMISKFERGIISIVSSPNYLEALVDIVYDKLREDLNKSETIVN